jgi:thiol-disulfide isomerase/thioredoxin
MPGIAISMMRKLVFPVFVFATALTAGPFTADVQAGAGGRPAPDFTHRDPQDWINSAPLALKDLRGRVVLLDFWAFDCWNCYRSFPWLKSVEKKFAGRKFTVIGVHTPELDHERVRANVVEKVKQFGLAYPVMLDNDYSYWQALGNRYWPAFYLIDKQGRVQAVYVGETHIGDHQALSIEERIAELLAEES